MVRRGPGHHHSTPSDRAERRRLRNARLLRLDFEAGHLRAAAEDVAAHGPRRSLRIGYLEDNAHLLHQGQCPWYHLVLFGEPGYFKPDRPPPPDGYVIIVTDGNDQDNDYGYHIQPYCPRHPLHSHAIRSLKT